MMAPAGAGTPTKKLAAQAGRSGLHAHDIEPREPKPGADRKCHGGDPASRFQIVQAPEIKDEPRRHAEIDEIGEAIEFRAEPRCALQQPRQAAVDAVQNRGEDDGRERQPVTVLERHANAGESGAEREQRDQVRRQRAHRNPAELPRRQTPIAEGGLTD